MSGEEAEQEELPKDQAAALAAASSPENADRDDQQDAGEPEMQD